MKEKIIILIGPTAVGKTSTSIELAKHINGEIISADSMQIYKYMNIGTAKPSNDETQDIPHHLIDYIDPQESFTVADFQREAKSIISKILSNKKVPIIAGGTGLYINSLIYDIDFTKTISNWPLRNQLYKEADMYGNEFIHEKLRVLDSESADRIHKNNIKRVIRAIEVIQTSGEKLGDFKKDPKLNKEYDFIIIGLTRNRQELYERIDQRVDLMIEDGLLEEVSSLLKQGYDRDLIAFKGLGYKEIINYLEGNMDLDRSIEILKRDTRRYAKRQLTWFRRLEKVKWYNLSEYELKKKT